MLDVRRGIQYIYMKGNVKNNDYIVHQRNDILTTQRRFTERVQDENSDIRDVKNFYDEERQLYILRMPSAARDYPSLNLSLEQMYETIGAGYAYSMLYFGRISDLRIQQTLTLTQKKDLHEIETAIDRTHTYIVDEALKAQRFDNENED